MCEMDTIKVYNLASDEIRYYQGITPKQAVIASYAQNRGDWNTWEYEKKYKATETEKFVACGNYCAKK